MSIATPPWYITQLVAKHSMIMWFSFTVFPTSFPRKSMGELAGRLQAATACCCLWRLAEKDLSWNPSRILTQSFCSLGHLPASPQRQQDYLSFLSYAANTPYQNPAWISWQTFFSYTLWEQKSCPPKTFSPMWGIVVLLGNSEGERAACHKILTLHEA